VDMKSLRSKVPRLSHGDIVRSVRARIDGVRRREALACSA
jgi:hypothetical protein